MIFIMGYEKIKRERETRISEACVSVMIIRETFADEHKKRISPKYDPDVTVTQ